MAKFEVVGLASGIGERCFWADDDKQMQRESIEDGYCFAEGSYTTNVYEQKRTFVIKRRNPFDLIGREVFLYKLIEEKLIGRQGKPLICLDFGGMFGVTWIRLAKWFAPKVKLGKIIFIVSNLVTTQQNLETTYKTNIKELDRTTWDDDGVFKDLEARKLVRYIRADARELWDMKINVRGKIIDLLRNIDIINENYTLGWSAIADLDCFILSTLLHQKGVMILGSKIAYLPHEGIIETMLENLEQNEDYSTRFSNNNAKVIFKDRELEKEMYNQGLAQILHY